MPKKTTEEAALFVRLPAGAADRLDRAAEALGMRKKDLVAGLVERYVDPDSPRALGALRLGSYSFQSYEPAEVLDATQAAELLQVDEETIVQLAEAGKLPGRKLGKSWRFSRAALVAWLSTSDRPERR
ncbi:MAG TPA: helix-turn-helix domain-containing protein [Polyangia bacterium]|nr:helix-turn-helix domain-containing protein [Polyangia bacterium]